MKKYEIRISKVVPSDTDVLKSMEIEVTDKRLLNLTNGIIQGMSGSPIIQDGKLIGAVTHVFCRWSDKRICNFDGNNDLWDEKIEDAF